MDHGTPGESRTRIIVAGADMEAVARSLRDEGAEVVFLGPGLDAAEVVGIAVQEDVSRIVLSGDAPEQAAEVAVLLAQRGIEDIAVQG